MTNPTKRPPIPPQARGGAVVSSRAIIAAIHTGEAVFPRPLADRMGLMPRPETDRTVVSCWARDGGKSLAMQMLADRQRMDPETFRKEYECVFVAHPEDCQCQDCKRYRRHKEGR